MSRTSDRRIGSDLGSALIEVLIASALIASTSVALAWTTSSATRTTGFVEHVLASTLDVDRVHRHLPRDLDSYPTVDTLPTAMSSLPGSNVITLSADPSASPGAEIVSYRYIRAGDSWSLVRYELATASTSPVNASHSTVAERLASPPPAWTSGLTPSHAVIVSLETIPDASSTLQRRSIVLVFDSGEQIHVSGLHRNVDEVPTTSPASVATPVPNARCGGSISIVLNTSSTIWSQGAAATVTGAISKFIDLLRGTPSHVRIVAFERLAYSFYPDVSVGTYVELLNPSTSLTALMNKLTTLSTTSSSWRNGRNWEDGIWQSTRRDTGSLLSQPPDLVVFLTDGVPNRNRTNTTTDTDTTFHSADLTRAVTAAEYARSTGATLYGIILGSGADTTATGHLISVFGSVQWDGSNNVLPVDRARTFARPPIEGFTRLQDLLGLIAKWKCSGTVTLQQRVVNAGITSSPVDTWSFDVTTSGSADTLRAQVGGNKPSDTVDIGPANAGSQRVVTIVQGPRTGYRHYSSACTSSGIAIPSVTTTVSSTGTKTVTVTAPADVPISCTLTSEVVP